MLHNNHVHRGVYESPINHNSMDDTNLDLPIGKGLYRLYIAYIGYSLYKMHASIYNTLKPIGCIPIRIVFRLKFSISKFPYTL